MPEVFKFENTDFSHGGPVYGNPSLADPGDDHVHFTSAKRRFAAIVVDWGVPLFLLWRLIDSDFLCYVILTAIVLNSVVMQGKTGKSVGKWIFGLQLAYVPQDMRLSTKVSFVVPGWKRCLIRFFLHGLDAFMMLGFMRCLWNSWGRSFADSLTKTVVIWDKRVNMIPLEEFKATR